MHPSSSLTGEVASRLELSTSVLKTSTCPWTSTTWWPPPLGAPSVLFEVSPVIWKSPIPHPFIVFTHPLRRWLIIIVCRVEEVNLANNRQQSRKSYTDLAHHLIFNVPLHSPVGPVSSGAGIACRFLLSCVGEGSFYSFYSPLYSVVASLFPPRQDTSELARRLTSLPCRLMFSFADGCNDAETEKIKYAGKEKRKDSALPFFLISVP